MAADDDLARLLPDPPPPRPGARETAIAAAMRRFDGVAVPDSPSAPGPAARPVRWWWTPSAQLGAFATVVLVGLISISVALHSPAERPGAPARESSAATNRSPNLAPPQPRRSTTLAPGGKDSTGRVPPEPVAPVTARADSPASADGGTATGRTAPPPATTAVVPAPPPPPPPSPPPPAPVAAPAVEPPIVTSARSPQALARSPVPPASKATAADDAANEMVVTGTRVQRRDPYAARGDWNACTVNDPEQSLRGCRRLIGAGAKGPAGEAAAFLSRGLSLAWQDDWQGAIEAFDRAVALKPGLAFAYLNRGLAYQRAGDLARAAADLDRAIKYAPYAARNYYNRGVLRRDRGDARGAQADLARAMEMDPDYPDPVIPPGRP